ncbi:MarR family winged helix-turn-helix transcriptional regulator [Streptomyces sp. WAC06614]|uniref:MarR family winged helix-turn-helix transcriptional regulator n=1 Tax=Streptomyces sp. WAC06614 TaxID=2487416 RepID=UPI000F79E76D|nr:MarR family winged helix-turn-helix transcriptional regulator [Streptomyces sp. WAC06614]RSS83609.1 MarR family transcriptional regulator [Streptomyces sp. WAC06614]
MSDEMALLVADVFEAAGALRRSGEAIAAAEGQTQARWQVLSVVSEQPMTVPSAARRLGVARQNVQRIANDLTHDGLAAFAPNPDHRTSPLLSLTPEGHQVLRAITARAEASHRRITARIDEADITAARALLRDLTRAVRQLEQDGPAPAGA